jgi:hypothetical protein
MIAGEVQSVNSTKILVAPLYENVDSKLPPVRSNSIFSLTHADAPPPPTRQLTVYCNQVNMTSEAGLMILPFPTGESRNTTETAGCEFYDLSSYKDLFTHLHYHCWEASYYAKGMEKATNSLSVDEDTWTPLKVHEVGSYQASIVPTFKDFSRIRQDVFVIKPELQQFLQQQYPHSFSFVVCQLKKSAKYHPFAYMHNMLPSGKLFIPTVHWHEHSVSHEMEKPFLATSRTLPQPQRFTTDWDHEIYCFNSTLTQPPRAFQVGQLASLENLVYDRSRNRLQLEKLPQQIRHLNHVSAYKIKHYSYNHDLQADLKPVV